MFIGSSGAQWRTPSFAIDAMIDAAYGDSGSDSGSGSSSLSRRKMPFLDLGCGDGRLMIAVAQRIGCPCIGYEISTECFEEARRNIVAAGLQHLVTVHLESASGEACKASLQRAGVVFVFSSTRGMRQLLPFVPLLPPHAMFVSYLFPFKETPSTTVCNVVKCFKPNGKSGIGWPLYCYTRVDQEPGELQSAAVAHVQPEL